MEQLVKDAQATLSFLSHVTGYRESFHPQVEVETINSVAEEFRE